MDKITLFKSIHKQFTDALRYITTNEAKLKANPKRWKMVQRNFEAKFETPLNEAWAALSNEEQDRLAPLYLHRKALQDKIVQKVMKTFNAKIVKVTKEKNEDIID